MAKYSNKAHYLGEPSQLTLEAIAGSLLRENFTRIIIGPPSVCGGPKPNPQFAFTATGYACESASLNQTSYSTVCAPPSMYSTVCAPPSMYSTVCAPPSSYSLDERRMKIHNLDLQRNPKVTMGDMDKIISSIIGSS